MYLNWEWFLGGKIMEYVVFALIVILILIYVAVYIIDPITLCNMDVQCVDPSSIKECVEQYLDKLEIKIDVPIEYRFVTYKRNTADKILEEDGILLGTFHKWNGKYYIDISKDLYKLKSFNEVVEHETRHMIVQYLKDKNIIDLSKYTEEIALEKTNYYNSLFTSSLYLLK